MLQNVNAIHIAIKSLLKCIYFLKKEILTLKLWEEMISE